MDDFHKPDHDPMKWLPLQLDLSPLEAVRAWPKDHPLAALWTGAHGAGDARWTLLTRPTGGVRSLDAGRVASDGFMWPEPFARAHGTGTGALAVDVPPFAPGWIGFLSYELGGVLEPAAAARRPASEWPLLHWQRFDAALAFDHVLGRWWALGDEGVRLARSLRYVAPGTFTMTEPASRVGQRAFEESVARAIEHIRAGDIYQANIAHPLRSAFSGSSREFFLGLASAARPWFGAYLEFVHADRRCAITSASPELFLTVDPPARDGSRRVVTRPMKGTRLIHEGLDESAARVELAASAKDKAELAMIVDLMRNDLGRACTARSIRVDIPHTIERHASLLQATAAVSGTLAPGALFSRLLECTFPGGSITGAPKIRAMQIIGELEPHARGPYCGSIGVLGDDGSLRLNIAIRTAAIQQPNSRAPADLHVFDNATLDYGVGAGVVADSTPTGEWEETLAKARVLYEALSSRP